MSLIERRSRYQCDTCAAQVEVVHDLDYECDAGYAGTEALQRAGWSWSANAGDLCSECFKISLADLSQRKLWAENAAKKRNRR